MSSAASLTNQRLDFARRFLTQRSDGGEYWMEPAFEQAAIYYLRSALNGLLQEVVVHYSLRSPVHLPDLLKAADEKGVSVPVLQELAQLSRQRDSWLSRLESSFKAGFECELKPTLSSDSLIASGGDAGAAATYYLRSLTDLVSRFREESAEY